MASIKMKLALKITWNTIYNATQSEILVFMLPAILAPTPFKTATFTVLNGYPRHFGLRFVGLIAVSHRQHLYWFSKMKYIDA